MIFPQLCASIRFDTVVQGAPPVRPQSSRPSLLRVLFIGRRPKFTLIRVAVLVAGCFVVFRFILLPIRVEGISMLPTYRDGRFNFVNRLAYLRHEPQRGDVVSIRLAGPSIMFMKRIIGQPGETVEFRHGRAFINGRPLDEPYLKLPCNWDSAPVTLHADQYYVVGDNRSMPVKDHEHGAARRDRIVGRVLL